jgi:Arc/MetJ family transcription regulator
MQMAEAPVSRRAVEIRLHHESAETRHYTISTPHVYDTCMGRTNVVIDDELLDIVIRRYGLRTKTEAIDLALRHLAGRPMSTQEALAMRGARLIQDHPQDQRPR